MLKIKVQGSNCCSICFFKAERSSQWKQFISLLLWPIQLKILYSDFVVFFSLAKLSQLPAEYSQKTMVLGSQNQKPEIGSIDTYRSWSSIIITNIIRVLHINKSLQKNTAIKGVEGNNFFNIFMLTCSIASSSSRLSLLTSQERTLASFFKSPGIIKIVYFVQMSHKLALYGHRNLSLSLSQWAMKWQRAGDILYSLESLPRTISLKKISNFLISCTYAYLRLT